MSDNDESHELLGRENVPFNPAFRIPENRNMAGEYRSGLALTPEERRRRILARGEARLRRILGRSPSITEETIDETPELNMENIVPDNPERGVNMSAAAEGEIPLTRAQPRPMPRPRHRNRRLPEVRTMLPFPVIIVPYVIIVKLCYSMVSTGYFNLRDASYIHPFFLLEFNYILHNLTAGRGTNIRLTHYIETFGRMNKLQRFLGLIVYPFFSMIYHFSIYFLVLCLLEEIFG